MIRENNAGPDLPDYPDGLVAEHHLGPRRHVETILAELKGAPLGYATLIPFYDSDAAAPAYWLDELYVAPAHRSRGVGETLTRAIQRHAREQGRVSVWWGVERDNTRAIAFYDRLGATDYKATIYRLLADEPAPEND